MKDFTLQTVLDSTGGKPVNFDGFDKATVAAEITSVTGDIKKVEEGSLYISKGAGKEELDNISAALYAGAAGVVSEKELPGFTKPYIKTVSVQDSLLKLAAAYRKRLDTKVIFVLGCAGKTTVKELLRNITAGTLRTFVSRQRAENIKQAVFEVFGIKESDQAAVLVPDFKNSADLKSFSSFIKPDIIIITNIGYKNLDIYTDKEGAFLAAAEVFTGLSGPGCVILNGDDEELFQVSSVKGRKPDFFGSSKEFTVCAEKVRISGYKGSSFELVMRDGGGKMAISVDFPLPGKHMIYNAMAAALAGLRLNIPTLRIKRGLENINGIRYMNMFKKAGSLSLIDDSKNATYESAVSMLDVLAFSAGRKAAILGDIKGLGPLSEKLHFKVGSHAGQLGLDLIVCVGEESEKTFMGARLKSEGRVEYYKTIEEAAARIPSLLNRNDTVLIKASEEAGLSRIAGMLCTGDPSLRSG